MCHSEIGSGCWRVILKQQIITTHWSCLVIHLFCKDKIHDKTLEAMFHVLYLGNLELNLQLKRLFRVNGFNILKHIEIYKMETLTFSLK